MSTMDKEAIFAVIVNHVREVLPELEDYSFEPADRLTELGASSIDRAVIVALALESLAQPSPPAELFGARNLGELTDLLHARLGSA